MPDTPTPQSTPPVQPPSDDGVFKVQHGSSEQPAQSVPPPVQPGQTIQPDQPAQDQPTEAVLPPVDQTQPIGYSVSPDLSKIPQALRDLAAEVVLPPAPQEPVGPPAPPEAPTAPVPPMPPMAPEAPPNQPLPPAQ